MDEYTCSKMLSLVAYHVCFYIYWVFPPYFWNAGNFTLNCNSSTGKIWIFVQTIVTADRFL